MAKKLDETGLVRLIEKVKSDIVNSQSLPYEISKVADYTYQMYCDTLDYDNAIRWFEETDEELTGACSSVRLGNFYGRNYDWTYDDTADFVVKTPRCNGRYATIGFGGVLGDITAEFVESGKYSPLYKVVPFKIVDGINEKGLICNINVVPRISDITHTTPNIDTEYTLCNRMLPRFVLDNFATAKEAAEYIRDHVSVYNHKELREGHNYDLHMMIADKNDTYLLEFMEESVDGGTVLRTVIQEMHDKSFMTNFHLSNVTFNEDGSVYTPYDKSEDTTHDPMTVNNIHKFGAGLERYNIINDSITDASLVNSKTIMLSFMDTIKYTNTYKDPDTTSDLDKWYSEGVGDYGESGEVTISSDKSVLDSIYNTMYGLYENRTRETANTWQTIHSCAYDIENRTVDVKFQEETVTFQFEVEYQKQVDWNQNDETKGDYIKNRTHYVISEAETSPLIEDTRISEDANQELVPDTEDLYATSFYINEMFILEEGKKYKITLKYTDSDTSEVITFIDGQIYEASYNDVYDFQESDILNHLSLILREGDVIADEQISLYNNNDDNFVICFINNEDKKTKAYDNQPYYLTVEEVVTDEVVKKIDKKFLPEMSSIKHLVDGSSDGSLRSINSVVEDGDYTIGENAVALGKDTMAIGENSFAEGCGCDYDYPISFEKLENEYKYRVNSNYISAVDGMIIRFNDDIYTISSVNADPDDDYHLIVEFEEGGPDDSFEGYLQGYASGTMSHVEGNCTTALGDYGSHSEGDSTVASGDSSHAEGYITKAIGDYSHTEGDTTIASGYSSHAEGSYTTASGYSSHAEGEGGTQASGEGSHAEGVGTIAGGNYSHTEGDTTIASGVNSHAEGWGTTANHKSQHVFGEYNIEDTSSSSASSRGNYIEIVGNGTDDEHRSNARTLDWNGNEYLAGKLTVGNTQETINGLFEADSSKAGKIPYINAEGNVVLTNRYESAAGLTANEVSVHDHRTEFADTTKYTPLMKFKHRNDMNKFQIEFSVSTIDSTGGNLGKYYARYIFYRSTIFGMGVNEGQLMCIDFNTSDQSLFNYTDIVAVSETIDNIKYTVFYKKNYHEYDYCSYCIHSMSTYSFDGLSGYVIPTYYVGELATNLKDGEIEITTSDLKSYSDFTTVFPCTPMNVNDNGNSILRKLYAGPIPTQSSITGNVTYTLADISKMMSVKLTGATTTITLPEPTDMTLDFKISVQQDATGGRNLIFTAPTANVYDINNSNFAAGTADQKCLVALSWDGTDWWMSASDYFNA